MKVLWNEEQLFTGWDWHTHDYMCCILDPGSLNVYSNFHVIVTTKHPHEFPNCPYGVLPPQLRITALETWRGRDIVYLLPTLFRLHSCTIPAGMEEGEHLLGQGCSSFMLVPTADPSHWLYALCGWIKSSTVPTGEGPFTHRLFQAWRNFCVIGLLLWVYSPISSPCYSPTSEITTPHFFSVVFHHHRTL